MLEVFLSFEGTYIKLYFVVRGWNVNVICFWKYSILYQRTYFSESIENFDWRAVDIF